MDRDGLSLIFQLTGISSLVSHLNTSTMDFMLIICLADRFIYCYFLIEEEGLYKLTSCPKFERGICESSSR
ncbi:unnamed protein product [Caenorhabditis angaria]|uniref:Uncharacterized protein n=1 Tax=Caenorhabditis angaria TaxID=860376 RepID=A0A9P1N9W1_9PELO|nr:unnamed protein product [Caenorhabditis angaria]